MKVLYLASECVPFIKTGGLADVAGSLPVALRQLGVDVRVMLPKYRIMDEYWKQKLTHLCDFTVLFGWEQAYVGIDTLEDQGVTYYFIDNQDRFYADRIYGDGMEEAKRFAFFCRAALEALPRIGFFPDVLHCNDWQTGLLPVLLKSQYQWSKDYQKIRTVFSVHNLRYQGIFPFSELNGYLGLDAQKYFNSDHLEFYGNLNCLKAGLVFSDRISTVSPTYAGEIMTAYYGEQMDGLLRSRGDGVTGILNGIDTVVYDPETDRFLENRYSKDDLSGKALCKQALQRECGLPEEPDVPVIGFIARLSDQKGLDLVERVLVDILRMRVQLVFLGSGEKHYMDFLNWAQWRYPHQLAFRSGMNEALAHRIYAGADLFLMPSQFEPCGLSQMIAQRYGTVPVVRETGGLRDTVRPYNQFTGEGDGFSFANYNAHEMLNTLERAVGVYYDKKDAWDGLVKTGMGKDFTWRRSAETYLAMYHGLTPTETGEAKPRVVGAKKKGKKT